MMLWRIEGAVAAILEDGFTVRLKRLTGTGQAEEVMVKTQIPGPRLSVSVGDRVAVTGGYGKDPGLFLSSHVTKFFPDGRTMSVHVNTVDDMFGPEEVTPAPAAKPARRRWWRFW